MHRQDIGKPGRVAQDQGQQRDEIRIAPQQRQEARSTMQAGEEVIERDESLIRTFRARQMVDQHRHEFGKVPAREFALERAVFAREPAPHHMAGFERPPKSHAGELVECLDIVLLGGKGQRAPRSLGGWRALEQPRIVALHLA